MKNYIDELRKKHFSIQLNLFNYEKMYGNIVSQKYAVQKIQSVKDLYEVIDFSARYNCILYLSDIKNEIGLIVIIKQSNPKNPFFFCVIHKPTLLITQYSVN
jgi:hypothetical protein